MLDDAFAHLLEAKRASRRRRLGETQDQQDHDQDHAQENRQVGAAINDLQHATNVLYPFHPVGSPYALRDETGGGVGSTVVHPAGESRAQGSPRVPNYPLAAPQPRLTADARQVVANPDHYAHKPLLRRLAWVALMSARGRRVDQVVLARMPVETGT